jgi:hypothetical protein
MAGKVEPYKRTPAAPTVCLLTPDGVVVSEHGETVSLDEWPEGYRAWCSYDTARSLILAGHGEGLCWNREEIRWRHRRFEEGWKRRPSDVNVIKLPFHDDDPEKTVRALCGWRDWLQSYGASPVGTSGGAAWSLLRARLGQPLWVGIGSAPPLRQTLGGRQELGPGGQGRYRGTLEHWDLPAAYAAELGGLRYGGRWWNTRELPFQKPAEWWARDGRAVFVRAVVKIPTGGYGPLPQRPRKRMYGLEGILLGAHYPVGKRMQGVWTWQELDAAERHGVTIVKVLDVYVHLAGDSTPFAPWWEAVQDGRRQPGLAGLLSKMTGNALWGRFCMDNQANGERSIRSKEGREIRVRPLPMHGGLPPVHDLAETVSGRTRARLYDLMVAAGNRLVSVHTDGAWTTRLDPSAPALDGWRMKAAASQVDILDPQVLRYWPKPRHPQAPFTVFSGVPASMADAAFDDAWARQGFEP